MVSWRQLFLFYANLLSTPAWRSLQLCKLKGSWKEQDSKRLIASVAGISHRSSRCSVIVTEPIRNPPRNTKNSPLGTSPALHRSIVNVAGDESVKWKNFDLQTRANKANIIIIVSPHHIFDSTKETFTMIKKNLFFVMVRCGVAAGTRLQLCTSGRLKPPQPAILASVKRVLTEWSEDSTSLWIGKILGGDSHFCGACPPPHIHCSLFHEALHYWFTYSVSGTGGLAAWCNWCCVVGLPPPNDKFLTPSLL